MAKMMSKAPPTQEKSRVGEEIFLPISAPAEMAMHPVINAKTEATAAFSPSIPLLRPVAEESRELARASAAASDKDRDFDLSKSAAVSSR